MIIFLVCVLVVLFVPFPHLGTLVAIGGLYCFVSFIVGLFPARKQ